MSCSKEDVKMANRHMKRSWTSGKFNPNPPWQRMCVTTTLETWGCWQVLLLCHCGFPRVRWLLRRGLFPVLKEEGSGVDMVWCQLGGPSSWCAAGTWTPELPEPTLITEKSVRPRGLQGSGARESSKPIGASSTSLYEHHEFRGVLMGWHRHFHRFCFSHLQ